ncbi:hypothetical protein BT67DRAFT_435026 [Trichocladium antarcticum]|uniref:Uncharacterized protein n=1 Tax=Trichocladium antarcticum TaxID=1450529 RepID=A0AAN6UHR5_9PEZI|nr:hypothetical protein BT67DRAFT_435026 [Trichocladium antarcticum]
MTVEARILNNRNSVVTMTGNAAFELRATGPAAVEMKMMTETVTAYAPWFWVSDGSFTAACSSRNAGECARRSEAYCLADAGPSLRGFEGQMMMRAGEPRTRTRMQILEARPSFWPSPAVPGCGFVAGADLDLLPNRWAETTGTGRLVLSPPNLLLNLDKSQIYRVGSGARLVVMYSGGGRSGSDKMGLYDRGYSTSTTSPSLGSFSDVEKGGERIPIFKQQKTKESLRVRVPDRYYGRVTGDAMRENRRVFVLLTKLSRKRQQSGATIDQKTTPSTRRKGKACRLQTARIIRGVCPYPWSLLHEVRNGSNSHGGASHHPCKLLCWGNRLDGGRRTAWLAAVLGRRKHWSKKARRPVPKLLDRDADVHPLSSPPAAEQEQPRQHTSSTSSGQQPASQLRNWQMGDLILGTRTP